MITQTGNKTMASSGEAYALTATDIVFFFACIAALLLFIKRRAGAKVVFKPRVQ